MVPRNSIVLIFGSPRDMKRIEFKRECDEAGLHCLAIRNVVRKGEHFRVKLKPKASVEWQRIEAEKVSAWVRRLGWRVCTANGLAKLRRSPRVNEGKGRRETASGSKGMGEKRRGAEQADKTRNGSGKKAQEVIEILVATTEKEQQTRTEQIVMIRKKGRE